MPRTTQLTKQTIAKRTQAVKAALGSVKAEGLTPSAKTQKGLKAYAAGKITISELRSSTLRDVHAKSHHKK